jgi:hypothetical protein
MVIFPHNFIDWLPIMRYNYVMEASCIAKRRERMSEILEDKNYWHPAFCGATELEFRDNKGDLEFRREL